MTTERYRFHCTDGQHAVFDRVGKRVADPALVLGHAERIAGQMMAGSGEHMDWSDWIVDIHDGNGRHVGTLAFTEIRSFQQAA